MNNLGIRALNIFEKVWWPIRRFIANIPYHYGEIGFFFQRGRRGWADCDWWNMDYYLVGIILPMLRELKRNGHCHPGDLTEEKWDELLSEMIVGFEAAKRICDNKCGAEDYIKSFEENQGIFEQKMKVFTNYFFSLWD